MARWFREIGKRGANPGDPEEPICPDGFQRLGEGARYGDSRELIWPDGFGRLRVEAG